jgi:DNA polymerase-3 subunit delta'
MLYPWQTNAWQRIQAMRSSDRIPHALLITGKLGTGIGDFAWRLATSMLCEAPSETGELCNQCQSCNLLKANTHPELLVIVPEEEGKAIKVDQIRKLMEFTQLKSHYGHRKVIVIEPADAMNNNANNSLLKTLEEPPGDTLLILVSHQPALLPITVRSRCQKIPISASSVHVKDWLAGKFEADLIDTASAIGYGPLFLEENDEIDLRQDRLRLLEDLEGITRGLCDPVEIAESWSKNRSGAGSKTGSNTDLRQVLFWLMKILQDLTKIKLTDNPGELANQDLIDRLKKLSELIDINKVIHVYGRLFELHKLVTRNTNLKPQTICEQITLDWATVKHD